MQKRLLPLFMLFPVTSAMAAGAPSPYPVITHAEQQARDHDRRAILEHELREEREIVAQAQAAYEARPTQEGRATLHRHAENVKTLLREIDAIAGKRSALLPRVQQLPVQAERPAGRQLANVQPATPSFWNPYNRALSPADRSLP